MFWNPFSFLYVVMTLLIYFLQTMKSVHIIASCPWSYGSLITSTYALSVMWFRFLSIVYKMLSDQVCHWQYIIVITPYTVVFSTNKNDSYNITVLVNSHSPTPYHNRSIWLTYWIQPDVIHLISVFFNKNLSATYEWYHWFIRISYNWLPGRSGLDRMIVAFTTTCTINAYHHLSCVLQSRARPTRYNRYHAML